MAAYGSRGFWYGDRRPFSRWSMLTLVLFIVLQFICNHTTAQCTGGLSCNTLDDFHNGVTDPNCHLIYQKRNGEYAYRSASSPIDSDIDVCYTFTTREETTLESCSETATECHLRGGTIATIDNKDQYQNIMNTVLDILSARTESKFNVLNGTQEEQCMHVVIQDGVFWNEDDLIQKRTNESNSVNALLCQQRTDSSAAITPPILSTSERYPVTVSFESTDTVSEMVSSSSQLNQPTAGAHKTSTTSIVIIVVVTTGILVVFILFAVFVFKVKKKKAKNQRGQAANIAMVTNTSYSNHDVCYEQNALNDDAYSVLNDDDITTHDADTTYTYAQPEVVTSHRVKREISVGYEIMESSNKTQLIVESDMYANVAADATDVERVKHVDGDHYDQINRSYVRSIDQDDTYNTLNADVGDQQHYDSFKRFKNNTNTADAPSSDNQYGTLDHNI